MYRGDGFLVRVRYRFGFYIGGMVFRGPPRRASPLGGGRARGIRLLWTSRIDEQNAHLGEFLAKQLPKAVEDPGVTSLTEHKINVGSNPPIKQRCYLVSPKVQEAICAEVDKMLAARIIEPSFSEWSNPVVMVKKPNGKYHFCLDFRKVNSVSKKDAYPLPNMNGILDKLRSARYISTRDLSQAYFQIPLATDSREISV